MSRAALALLVLPLGCAFESLKYKSYPPNPYPDLQKILILPFYNHSLEARMDGVEFANLMANELLKFDGFQVVRPQQILAAGAAVPRNAEDALRLARQAKVDAVIVVAVTDYDPYDPPRVGVSVQFLRAQGRSLSGADIDRIVQSASWRRGPLEMSREKAGNWMDAFETVYDAHEERIRREVVAYAQAQEESDSPFVGEKEFLAVQSRYLQFVSNQVLNRLFDRTAPE